MDYTVEALAKLSKISIRTLHYYDEIGLLKPSIRMKNGRRHYGIEQLLNLQQILYFKQLGFTLQKIRSILNIKNKDKVSLLSLQKQLLTQEIGRLTKVIGSIDKTIEHYQGCTMTQEEVCKQFKNFQKTVKECEKACEQIFGEKTLIDARKKINALSREELEDHGKQCIDSTNRIVDAMNRGLTAESEEVQILMQEHFELSSKFQPPSKEQYLASLKFLRGDSPLHRMCATLHPELPDFLYRAMQIFATRTFI